MSPVGAGCRRTGWFGESATAGRGVLGCWIRRRYSGYVVSAPPAAPSAGTAWSFRKALT